MSGRSSAVFVGNGSLLIQCADAYREAGHAVVAVASRNKDILAWADVQGIRSLHMDDAAWWDALPAAGFDDLFSVANLDVLPGELVGRARRLAINFHDALLPRYAGLNATSWALLAQETVHGVTWHEMTAAVDTGRILKQVAFAIAADETALSLNARCYEAGLGAFKAILGELAGGHLAFTAQEGERSYFGRARRPDALATLDFSRPARELAALVRGLDHGLYPNFLARPKILLGDKVLWFRTARALERLAPAAPGTVMASEGDTLRVATGEGDILLGEFSDARGHAVVHGIPAGSVLPLLDAALRARFAARLPQIAAGEAFWSAVLASNAPTLLSYPQKPSAAQPGKRQLARLELATSAAGASTVAGFFAWMSALLGQERICAMYTDTELSGQAEGLAAWVSHWVPLALDFPVGASVAQAAAAAAAQIASSGEAGPCPLDLASRLGDKQLAAARWDTVAVCMDTTARRGDFELLLAAEPGGRGLALWLDEAVYAPDTMTAIASHLDFYLGAFAGASGAVGAIPLMPPHEADMLVTRNGVAVSVGAGCVHEAITAQCVRTAGHTAIVCQGEEVSYRALDEKAVALALRLIAHGVKPGDVVGLCLERTPELVVAVLAILKTGAAYLPLDPDYPRERLLFMVEDSRTRTVVTDAVIAAALQIPADKTFLLEASGGRVTAPADTALPVVEPGSAAYVIYTSGSTGQPKGVVVTHANVMNFFAGMDQRVPHDPPGCWLAVTSLSFDISVLELCWTLARGFTVVLHSNSVRSLDKPVQFSLFYFANDDSAAPADRYKLLMEGAKFADREGFCAIWTPERHFHAFGGLYPNPALTSAAIAAVTTRLQIRAGSCVLPLHHPIRVAEEWAFVDNISQGRVGVSFASGWQPNDFAIAPGAFASRKADMLANVDVVRRLWRGESVAFPGPLDKPVDVQTLPRPIQKELPVWLTAAGNPETFEQAGTMGCNLLTHLLGQTIESVAEKLRLYHAAWQKAGHVGRGHVTMMLHTFIGQDEDEVRKTVRQPMKDYLRSSVDLIKQAAWSFPTFVQRGSVAGKSPAEIMDAQALSAEDMDALLEHAFNRYYGTSALFGTPQHCLAMVQKLKGAGVDEIACLIDFGIASGTVLAHLRDLKQLMDLSHGVRATQQRFSVGEAIVRHGVTHLQCTPSMASMLVADRAGQDALSRLSTLLVGGEALPLPLARELRALVPGSLLNMYGPTETTVWSTTCDLQQIGAFVPLGTPIANTQLAVRNARGMECPALVPGELYIGGKGVTGGYLHREELTTERFVADPASSGARMYRTGDLVRRHADGALEFLGRIDNQVKIRGHRIELGEIESALQRQSGVKEAAVIAQDNADGDLLLVAYVTPKAGALLAPAALRSALGEQLPAIMVPGKVLVLQAFPLTPNGKTDRRALAATRPVAPAAPATAPWSQLEKVVAGVWCEVLGMASVAPTDNFFDLGGHSLLVIQVQRRLQDATGHPLSITDMFRLPTVRALASHLGGAAVQTAVSDGLNRAHARRAVSRVRSGAPQTPAG